MATHFGYGALRMDQDVKDACWSYAEMTKPEHVTSRLDAGWPLPGVPPPNALVLNYAGYGAEGLKHALAEQWRMGAGWIRAPLWRTVSPPEFGGATRWIRHAAILRSPRSMDWFGRFLPALMGLGLDTAMWRFN